MFAFRLACGGGGGGEVQRVKWNDYILKSSSKPKCSEQMKKYVTDIIMEIISINMKLVNSFELSFKRICSNKTLSVSRMAFCLSGVTQCTSYIHLITVQWDCVDAFELK